MRLYEKFVIGIIICMFFFGAGFGTNYYINRGRLNDFRTTIIELGDLDIERGKEIVSITESNIRLREEVEQYRDEITNLYNQLRDGIGMAGNQTVELEQDFRSMARQIRTITEGIKAVRASVSDLRDWLESRGWIQPGMVVERTNNLDN